MAHKDEIIIHKEKLWVQQKQFIDELTRELKRAIQKYEQEKLNWTALVQKGQEEELRLTKALNEAKADETKAR